MSACDRHWAEMRRQVDDAGLSHLIAKDGEEAAARQIDQLRRSEGRLERLAEADPVTVENFDPLMSVFWGVTMNVGKMLGETRSGDAIYAITDGMEDPLNPLDAARLKRLYRQRGVDREAPTTWPRCSLCYANVGHALSCKDGRCMLDRVDGFDWMIEMAVKDAVNRALEFGLPVIRL